jgi:uncharacterized protein (DUF1499 family)
LIRNGLVLSLAGAALLLAGPIGTRAGLWSFVIGFLILGVSVLVALAGASLSLVGGIKTGRWKLASAGIILGLVVVSVPSAAMLSARDKPPIHDVTTDTDSPPPFIAILPLRTGAANPPEYPGIDAATQQQRAYADIQPLDLSIRRDEAFDRALASVRALGWNVVGSDREAGRIEAVDTTFWFGFQDDVVIRVKEVSAGTTRIDVRSKSRVGTSDFGRNAQRIRALLDRVKSQR